MSTKLSFKSMTNSYLRALKNSFSLFTAASIDKTSSHISFHLNTRTHKVIRWCTPSIDPLSIQIENPYKSDISISHQLLGYPSEPSGIFKHAYERAASAYGADQTLFSVNGSTGSNFVVLRTLSKQFPKLKILAQRNLHKSIIAACEDYKINIVCLPHILDTKLQIFLPNRIEDFLDAIAKEKPHVLLLTNPTYEGFTLDLKTLVSRVRAQFPDVIIFVDEAWGAHLPFSNKLPICAMHAGADICVQSTHKQGGALQQGGMIHWQKDRIDSVLLLDSFRRLTTTSPSYILLASLDAAREMMEKRGSKQIDFLVTIASKLSQKLKAIPGIRVIELEEYKKEYPSVFGKDETKVLIDVSGTGISGFEFAKILEEKFFIIVEKYDAKTLLFLTPLQAMPKNVDLTVVAIKSIIARYKQFSGHANNQVIPEHGAQVIKFGEVENLTTDEVERIPIEKAKGRIAAENITPYPPGIPLTLQGEELTEEAISFYTSLKKHSNAHIVANDQTLHTVTVVKEKA